MQRVVENYITKDKGPCVILAGAGTGKTHAIIEKIKYLIESNLYKPEEILCLTFSNEAARSMEARILSTLDRKPTVRTFHALCSDLLKEHGPIKEFRIIEPDDSKIMLHKNLKIAPRVCEDYVSSFGMAKDLGISIDTYEKFIQEEKSKVPKDLEQELEKAQFELRTLYAKKPLKGEKLALQEKIERYSTILKRSKFLMAWKAYEKLKSKKQALDYSDLNTNTLVLLEAKPSMAKWKYLVVDEFQDTNKVQLDLLNLLAPHKNITIVGDTNQSIYRFRGAYKDNLEQFNRIFDAKDKDYFSLDKSRRSPNKILRLAHAVIKNNYENKNCPLTTNLENIEGDQIQVHELKNTQEETRKILEIIQEELKTRKPEEICIIFRTHQQSSLLKRTLEQNHVQYHSTIRKPLMKHPIIRTISNYLTIINSLQEKRKGNAQAWWELVQSHLPHEDVVKIGEFMRSQREALCLSELMLEAHKKTNITEESKKIYEILTRNIQELSKISSIKDLLDKIYTIITPRDPEKSKENRESLLVIQEFKSLIEKQLNHEFFDISSIVYHFDIMRLLDVELEAPAAEERGIRIMTAHATKGLEYPVVIVSALGYRKFPLEKPVSRGLIPSELLPELKEEIKSLPRDMRESAIESYEKEQQLKDERRLCYVAFTRAKNKLYLTYAREYNNKENAPSQFLLETDYTKNQDIILLRDYDEKFNVVQQETKAQVKTEKIPSFSPSSLKTFLECQKKYEYKYVFNMPDPEPPNWEAINLGSFVHKIIEHGVKENFSHEREFVIYAREESLKPEWANLNINEAILLIKVFFERNKSKYNANSRTEEKLHLKIDGIKFFGVADRIDITPEGLEIIDYKTGYSSISPRDRNWQLGYYALAANQIGKVKRVTLDMLRHDRPLEFEIDEKGIAKERNTGKMSFSLEEVKQELLDTARQITKSFESGFKPCPIDKNCEFCTEHVWKIS